MTARDAALVLLLLKSLALLQCYRLRSGKPSLLCYALVHPVLHAETLIQGEKPCARFRAMMYGCTVR